MGKRKSKTKVIKVKGGGLSSSFDCYACHAENCIVVNINKDLIGTLRCRSCNFSAQYPCNPLDRAIDVYAMWVDQIHALNNGDEADLEDYLAGGEYSNMVKVEDKTPKKEAGGVKRKIVRDYNEIDGLGVEGDASEDEYDGDDLDVYDRDVVTDNTDDEDEDDGKKRGKKSSKKDKKSRKSMSDDEDEFGSDFGSDSEAESSKSKKSSRKSSKKDKKEKKDKKDDKKDKKSKKFRSNAPSDPAGEELVQLAQPKKEIVEKGAGNDVKQNDNQELEQIKAEMIPQSTGDQQ